MAAAEQCNSNRSCAVPVALQHNTMTQQTPDTSPRIVFMGTPDFAVASLEAIHRTYPVIAVVTTPDRPKGRGLKLQSSPVKVAAERLGIPTILQPETLKDPAFRQAMEDLQPDIIAVVAFRILPRSIYSLARLGAFNVHGSLLPKYRGAAPINRAIMNGETETGVTSFLLADVVDTGAMLDTRRLPVPDGMTAGELHDALMPLAAELAVETCTALIEGTAQQKVQDDTEASQAPKIFRDDCHIPWHGKARDVRNFIHGLSPYPGAWTIMNGKMIKIFRAELRAGTALAPGEFSIDEVSFTVGCGEGILALLEVQPEGKRPLPIEEFLRGYRGPEQGLLE